MILYQVFHAYEQVEILGVSPSALLPSIVVVPAYNLEIYNSDHLPYVHFNLTGKNTFEVEKV